MRLLYEVIIYIRTHMISIFNVNFSKVETNVPGPNILRMCSHLDLEVNLEISNRDTKELSEAFEPRR